MNAVLTSESQATAAADRRVGVYAAILVSVYLLAACWNLNIQTISHPDEPRYAAAAREMLRTGDWIVPMFNAQPRLVKPILFYWELAVCGAAGPAIGMPMATAFRLGPILMGLLAVMGAFLLGSRWRSPRYGFVAALILMTTFEFHKLSRELVCDMTLTVFLLWSWLFFHIAVKRLESQASAFAPLLGFYLCLGLACMTKGPFLVAIFVVLPLLAYLLWTDRMKLLLRSGIFWGAPLSLAMGLWWSWKVKARGLDAGSFYSVENIQRFLGAKDHTKHYLPFIFYLETLVQNFAPWVLLIPVAVWWSWKMLQATPPAVLSDGNVASAAAASPRGGIGSEPPARSAASLTTQLRSISDPAKMLTCCLAIPFFIMGVSISKRPLYLLPIYPYLALWVAWLIDAAYLPEEGQSFCRRCANVLAVGAVVLFGGLAVAAQFPNQLLVAVARIFGAAAPQIRAEKPELVLASALFVVLALAGVSAAMYLKAGQRYQALLRILAMAVALIIGYEAIVMPIQERQADREKFFAAVKERIGDHEFAMYGESSNEAVWFMDRREELKNLPIASSKPGEPGLQEGFFDKPGVLLLAPVQRKQKHELDPKLLAALRVLGEPIVRGPDKYILAEPDPDHPPDKSIFVPKKGQDPGDAGED